MNATNKFIKSFLLSLSSFSPGLLLFLLTVNLFPSLRGGWFSLAKFVLLTVFTIVFSVILIVCLAHGMDKNGEDSMTVANVQPIESETIPTYLGLFIIMLSLGELAFIYQALVTVMMFFVWWLLMERSYYFNIVWLILYRYYRVQDEHGNVYTIYSYRRDFKLQNKNKKLNKLVRVNNFTFIEIKENK
ncbi:hypothetical protein [Oenococcus sp.]|uniref:hypothetical protein n=1 Tax=Oenococcus sp. TaxID=1979414 RepID=UPI0039E85669